MRSASRPSVPGPGDAVLIGEVARRSGVSTRMLRHYDSLGLVRPTGRTVGGYREYSDTDIRRIFHVESLRTLGLSLRDVARALEDPAFSPQELITELIAATEARMSRERDLLEQLRAVDAAAPTAWPEVWRTIELMRELSSPEDGRRQKASLALPDGESLPPEVLVRAFLRESTTNVAGALRWALVRGGAAEVLAQLAPAALSEDREVRMRALTAIAEVESDEASSMLIAALGDPEESIREFAALAVGARASAEAIPQLVAMVVTGHNDVDAADALAVLAGQTGRGGEIVESLAAAASGHPEDPSVRIRVCQALVELPHPDAGAALERLAADGDPSVALVAAAFVRMRAEIERTNGFRD